MTEILQAKGAKLTLYRDAPDWQGRAFAVGQFRADTAEEGASLLARAAEIATADGASLIGPMDGDTWHSYRLQTETDGRAAFLMEPASRPQDLPAFQAAGFVPISEYLSASVPLAQTPPRGPDPEGLRIAAWDGTDPEALFAAVHDLSCTAFARNPFYKPISLDQFLPMYLPFVPMLKRELILFAWDGPKLVGFLFGMPNYAEGPAPKSAILKTYASLHKGAGHALATRFYQAARDLGCDTAIHALMHADNLSALRSAMNGAEVFRRYALMGRAHG